MMAAAEPGTATVDMPCPRCGAPIPMRFRVTVLPGQLEAGGPLDITVSADTGTLEDARRHLAAHDAKDAARPARKRTPRKR